MTYNISGKTKLVGLLGDPVTHSISPKMHNISFEYLNLDYAYLAFGVKSENFNEAVIGLKALDVVGFNITMPYKKTIFPLLNDVSKEAQLIGSVNTVLKDNGMLIGYNTDGQGYAKSLYDEGISIKGKKVVIAGAGGAARSIAIQLALDGATEVVIFNRNVQAAKEICNIINDNQIGCKTIAYCYTDDLLKQNLKEADLFINCTSLGMGDNIDKSIITNPDFFNSKLIVSDVIYAPSKTKLLKMAENVGCKVVNGLGMLIGQGALAFKIWTGKDMPIEIVKNELFK